MSAPAQSPPALEVSRPSGYDGVLTATAEREVAAHQASRQMPRHASGPGYYQFDGGRYAVLSAVAQTELVTAHNAGAARAVELRAALAQPKVPASRQAALTAMLAYEQQRATRAAELIVGAVYRLLHLKVTEHLHSRTFDATQRAQRFEDLMADACAEACAAMQKYQPERGAFTTWVVECVEKMLTGSNRAEYAASLPSGADRLLRWLPGLIAGLRERLGTEPSVAQIREAAWMQSVERERSRLADTNPPLTEAELLALVTSKLTRSGVAAALEDLPTLIAFATRPGLSLDIENTSAVVAAAMQLQDTSDQVCARESAQEASALLEVAFGGLDAISRDAVAARFGELDGNIWSPIEVARRTGLTAGQIKALMDRTQSRLRAPHAQYIYLAPISVEQPPATARMADRLAGRRTA